MKSIKLLEKRIKTLEEIIFNPFDQPGQKRSNITKLNYDRGEDTRQLLLVLIEKLGYKVLYPQTFEIIEKEIKNG